MAINQEIIDKLKSANIFSEKVEAVKQSLKDIKVIKKAEKPKPKFTSDGKRPEPGCPFYYQSKYSDVIIEGVIAKVQYDSITSINGTKYDFKEIWIKDKGEMREELINKIFNEK